MSASRTLSLVNLDEESVAHVRLLLRMAGAHLHHRWELGDSEQPDLVIMETGGRSSSGTLQSRYQAAGIPVAIVCDADAVVVHGMVLRRPIRLKQLAAVLNAAAELRPGVDVMPGVGADFYNAELGDQIPTGSRTGTWDQPEHATADAPQAIQTSSVPADGSSAPDAFDLMVHGDPMAAPEPKATLLSEDTALEPMEDSLTARSSLRRDGAGGTEANLLGVSTLEVEPISLGSTTHAPGNGQRGNQADPKLPVVPPLLVEGAILSPVRVTADGVPELVLDPKQRRFHTAAPLHKLAPYADADASVTSVSPIVGSDLQEVRSGQHARPFDELAWLFALATSRGRLDPSLDPGGSYAVTHAVHGALELRGHGRIVALMTTPMPLHEIARASGAQMEEVFDVVNAYHAIDRLEYIPRQRLQQKSDKNNLFRLFTRK